MSTVTFASREIGGDDASSTAAPRSCGRPSTASTCRRRGRGPDRPARPRRAQHPRGRDRAGRHRDGEGVHRAVDPADGEVYLWTSFEPDEARLRVGLLRPAGPQGARTPSPSPRRRTGPSSATAADPQVDVLEDARRWTFAPTPPLSTYNPVVNAGPFHEVRRTVGRLRPRPVRAALARGRARPRRGRAVHRDRAGPARSTASSSGCRSRRRSTTRCSCPRSAAPWRTTAA